MNRIEETLPRRVLPIVLLLLLTVIFFYPIIFQDKTFYAFDVLQNYPPWQGTGEQRDAHPVNNQLITDPLNIFYPAHETYQQGLRDGVLPFWNHRLFAGTPFTPYFGSPIHYFLFSTLSISVAHDLLLFLHMAGMALMMYLYLKKLNLVTSAALFGAISWMFNGYVMVWFEFENVAMMALTLPGTLYFIERWFRRRSWANFLGLSGILSLSMTSGYAHLLIYQLLLVGAYVAFRYFTLTPGFFAESISQHARALSGPALALLVSLLAGSLFISSHLSLMEEGHREAIPFDTLYESTGKLPGRYLITLVFPYFYGSPTLRDGYLNFTPKDDLTAYPYNNFNELCVYGGIVTLLFALIGVLYSKWLSGGRFFVATYAIGLAIAMGSIIYWPFATFVPGLSLSTPTRILYINAFALCVLAAGGMHVVLTRMNRARWPIIVSILALVFLSFGTVLFMQEPILQRATIEDWMQAYQLPWSRLAPVLESHFNYSSMTFLQPLSLLVSASILLLGFLYAPKSWQPILVSLLFSLMVFDQAGFGWNYNSRVDRQTIYPETPGIRFLKNDKSLFRVATMPEFLPNSLLPFGIEDVGGYSSFFPRRFGELIHLAQEPKLTGPQGIRLKQWYNFESLESPIFSMLNTKYLLAAPGSSLDAAIYAATDNKNKNNLELVYKGEMDIYENKRVLPRVYFVPQAIYAEDRANAYRMMASHNVEDFMTTVIIEGDRPVSDNSFNDSPSKLIQYQNVENNKEIIQSVHYQTNKITLSADVQQKGFLVISTNYHPDWQASIEGKNGLRIVEPRLANYSVMAIPVIPGKQEVALSFEPTRQIAGLYLSALVWILLLAAMLHSVVKYMLGRFRARSSMSQR